MESPLVNMNKLENDASLMHQDKKNGRASTAASASSSGQSETDGEREDANIHEREGEPKVKDKDNMDKIDWELKATFEKQRADAAEQLVETLQKRLEVATQLTRLLEEKVTAADARREEAAAFEARAHAAEELLRLIGEELQCPITHGSFRHPVVASDGRTYERRALRRWARQQRAAQPERLARQVSTSPITRAPLLPRKYENRLAVVIGSLLADAGIVVAEPEEGGDGDSASDLEGPEPELRPQEEQEEQDFLRAAAGDRVASARQLLLVELISYQQEAAALQLLQAPEVPGLNDVEEGMSTLTMAIHHNMWEVASGILVRRDFVQMNAGAASCWTALHEAASKGHVELCRAILRRPDFAALDALDYQGRLAVAVAADFGHQEVAEILTTFIL